MNVRTTGPPVPSTEEESVEMPRVLVFAFEKIEFFAHRRCRASSQTEGKGVTRQITSITISEKIFAQAMVFQWKVGKVRALSALRDTVVFQIHRARSYTKCPRRCSRLSYSFTRGFSERYFTRAVRIKYNRKYDFVEVSKTLTRYRFENNFVTRKDFHFVNDELLRLPLDLGHRHFYAPGYPELQSGPDNNFVISLYFWDEVSLLRRNEALNRCLIVDRLGFLQATRAPYLLSRDEISPKRDRPRFEGSQEAFEPMTDDRRIRPIFRLNSCESYTRPVLSTKFHGSRPWGASKYLICETNRPILNVPCTYTPHLIIFLNNFSQHDPVSTFLGAFGFLARKGIIVRFLVECGLTYARSIRRPGNPHRGWPDITRCMSGPRLSPEGETGLALLAWQGRFFLAFPNALCSSPRVRIYTVYAFSRRTIGIVFARGVTTVRDAHRQVWPQRDFLNVIDETVRLRARDNICMPMFIVS
ncbi:hypothetical protein ALC62_13890 [Cyphomyrmex costatus]|uniref:Uncharacterized protein n=1 Tax=Cyphomyrmex costatus TaxID=456900 RepID=A0A195C3N5_9HYME|nr:hypothetical protein ALC62_13890 [Cyphomyrmex costatus]